MARVIIADRDGSDVVPGRVARAEAEAERVLGAAQTRANEIIAQAQSDAAAVVSAARDQATAAAIEATLEVQASLAAARDRILAEARGEVLSIGIAAAEKIIGKTVEEAPELMEAIVQPLLLRLRRARRLELRLHPDDARALEPKLQALTDQSGLGCPVRIESDPEIQRGGCVLRSDIGALDARIETRLERVARALEPLFQAATRHPEGATSD
jgi:flagellar biosynthesis/type III secretory pathway protein FliH